MYEEQKHYIENILAKGARIDGRKLLDFRDISIEYDVSVNAEGSARVKIGDTEVLVGVKMSIEKPFPDTPEEGGLMVNAELLPLSSPEFEAGPPNIDSIELARIVDKGIRESKAIDNKKLCIEKSEKAWFVNIDIMTINNDGNLLDAAAIGALAALKDTKFPEYDGTTINYKKKTNKILPLNKEPTSITVYKIGKAFIVDPSVDEEKVYDARLTVASTPDGKICALQKGGDAPLTTEEIDEMVGIAIEKSKEIRKFFK